MAPKPVSVIVPTRNSARVLAACLGSIRAQTYLEIELVVVDNHSDDGTREIAQRFADRVELWGPERSAQRNRGAQLATGDSLLFIDSDMRLGLDVVENCSTVLVSSGAPAVIIPEVSIGEGFWAACRALERSCYTGDDSVEAARFFARAAFISAGGYDERLVAGEDWDLSDRVAAGRSLPRSQSTIVHDEGRLKLSAHLKEKRYYGASLRLYLAKQPSSAGRTANIVLRSAYLHNWRKLLSHPLLTAGMLLLKPLEAFAVLTGAIAATRPKEGRKADR